MGAPSPWVRRWAPLAGQGEVLDLACGRGRHARLFAALGRPVLAVDRDRASLEAASGTGIATLCFDLEDPALAWPFAPGRFATIVVTNYLHRPLMPQLLASLAPGGMLIYETFAKGNEAYGKPSNPLFLLDTGELLRLASGAGLHVLAFEDGIVDEPSLARIQRIAALRPGFSLEALRLETGRH